MKREFKRVEEFFGIKEKCLFCGVQLRVVLANYSASANHIPVIKARPVKGKFSFDLRHTTEKFDLDTSVELDIKSNNLFFTFKNQPDPYSSWQRIAKRVFEDLGPHLELYCTNRQCKHKYTISSDRFQCDYHGDFLRIKPFLLLMESFVVGKHWVMNDWSSNKTLIFSQVAIEAEPLKMPLLELASMSGDKIITRIQTLVTFS